jgi:tetratricopeptide (TPR) repeat protein
MNKRLEGLLEFYKKDPDDPFVLYTIALEYAAEKNIQNAEQFFTELLNKNPGYVAGYLQFAQLKEKKNELEEAKSLYRKGIEAAIKSGDKKSAKEMEEFLDDLE